MDDQLYVWNASGERPCGICAGYAGQIRTLIDWAGLWPAHPGCLCTLEPVEATPMQQFLFSAPQPLALAAGANRRYRCTLLAAGELRGHGLHVAASVLERDAAKFANVEAFVDHGFWTNLERLAGLFEGVAYDPTAQAITGTLVLKSTPAADWLQRVIDEVIADQANGAPALDVGLSADCWVTVGEPDPASAARPVTAFHAVSSVDIVCRPASDGARFERILAQAGPIPANPTIQEVPMSAPVTPVAEPENDTTPAPAPPQAAAPPASAPVDIVAELQAVRAQLEQLAARQAITGFDTPRPQPLTAGQMANSQDQAQQIVDWMFGAPGAALPEPQMRTPRNFYHAFTGDWEWTHRVHAERAQFAAASTTTLADLAVNAMNKVIVNQWDALVAYRWFEAITIVTPNDGTGHNMEWITFGGVGNLPTVAEGAAYTELSVADSGETDSFVKKGGYIGVTEEMWRKNDLQRMQAIPRELAAAAVRTRSAAIAAIFTVNSGVGPTLDDDSTALFNSAHGSNLQTTAFSLAAWQAARLECFKMAQLGSGKRLGLYPKYALIPGDLLDAALVAFGYGAGPGGFPGTGNNDVNPYAGNNPYFDRPVPIVVPDWTDVNDWAYLTDPNVHPVIMMSYLESPGGRVHPMPTLQAVVSPLAGLVFTNDTLPVKVKDWWAAGVATWRGIGKRNVT